MNILLLSTHLNVGGISQYVITLASGLKKEGHRVWVASSGGSWVRKLQSFDIPHKFIPINTKSIISIKILISFFILQSFLRKEKIQLVHSNSRVTQFLGYLIYKFCQIPYVSTFHGFYNPKLWRKKFRFEGLETIAVSNSVKVHLINELKIPENKITVIYNGLDINEFSKKKKNRFMYGFSNQDILIGILGRISEEKGHLLVAKAIAILKEKYQNIKLLICGWGRLIDELVKLLEDLKIRDDTRFFYAEADEFLDIIDILVIPSKKEGFGYVILEAFAKSTPVIGYNVGGIAEIIKHNENGLLFYEYTPEKLAETIQVLIQDETLKNKIVKNAKKSVLEFSQEKMVNQTCRVYQKLIR